MQGRILKKPLPISKNQQNVTGQLLLHCKTHAGHGAGEQSEFLLQEMGFDYSTPSAPLAV